MSRHLVPLVVLAALSSIPTLSAQRTSVSGVIVFEERVTLPPTAVVEVSLSDVSRADAPAGLVAQVRQETPSESPIPFDLPYDASRIDPRNRYGVRARILDGERVLFSSARTTLVLTQGRGTRAELLLQMVSAASPASTSAQQRAVRAAVAAPMPKPLSPVVELRNLPATFRGTLPCAGCPGLQYELNLFADDSFFLRTTRVGAAAGVAEDTFGSWVLSSDRRVVVLSVGGRAAEMFAIRDNSTLRKLDSEGREIAGAARGLRRSPRFEPLDVRASMTGAYTFNGESGRFVECSTGQAWPVAEGKSSGVLQDVYRVTGRKIGTPILLSLEAQLTSRPARGRHAPESVLVVEQIGQVRASESCPKRFAALPLEETRWRLATLGVTPVAATNPRTEPGLRFRAESGSFSATSNCRRVAGRYQLGRESLTMSSAGVMAACRTGDGNDAAFSRALNETRRYRILGNVLEVYDDQQQMLARFEGE